jgi:pilus assembly protein Flp/PilA
MLQILDYLKARASVTEEGAAAVEYGLLVALIAAVVAAAVLGLGTEVKDTFTKVTTAIAN